MESSFKKLATHLTREDLGETPENKKNADDMTEALLHETLKRIDKK